MISPFCVDKVTTKLVVNQMKDCRCEWPPLGPIHLYPSFPTPRGSPTHVPWGFLKSRPNGLVQTYGLHLTMYSYGFR